MVSCKFISNGKIKYNDVKLSNKHFENDEKKTVTSCKTNKPSEQICGYFNAEVPLYKTRLYRCKERNLFSLNFKYLLTSRFNFL